MSTTTQSLAFRFGGLCRTCAVVVLSGVWRSRTMAEINDTVKSRPISDQIWITAGVLGLLFALSLVAAQFGWVGLLVYWLAVVILVN